LAKFFSTEKGWVLNLAKYGLGYILGPFFSQTHLVTLVLISCKNRQTTLSVQPGANPTIVSYNAGAVKIYNATNCLA
jgi:hypothetical protein